MNTPTIRRATLLSAAAVLSLTAVGCGNAEGGGEEAASADETLNIAFFGFSSANSFAQATFDGIEEYAGENNAEATFFDGEFDASTQVQQIQDATASGEYDVFIVQANDGAAVINPVEAAVNAGITVVAEFTPVGTEYDTAEAQIEAPTRWWTCPRTTEPRWGRWERSPAKRWEERMTAPSPISRGTPLCLWTTRATKPSMPASTSTG